MLRRTQDLMPFENYERLTAPSTEKTTRKLDPSCVYYKRLPAPLLLNIENWKIAAA